MKKDSDQKPNFKPTPLMFSSIETQKKQRRLLAIEEEREARELQEAATRKSNSPSKDKIRYHITLNNPISKDNKLHRPVFAAQLAVELEGMFKTKKTTTLTRHDSWSDDTWNKIYYKIKAREAEIKNNSPAVSVPGTPISNSPQTVPTIAAGDSASDSNETLANNANDSKEAPRRSTRITMRGYRKD